MINNLRHFIGYFGELLLLMYLRLKCYDIIKHRYCCKSGEVDLIVLRRKELVFLEVKTSLFGQEIPISNMQSQSIVNSSKHFLSKNVGFLNHSIRYNLCFLSLRRGFVYIQNAWLGN